MTRYELTLSLEYVKHWTAVEAVRELLQNGVDQENMSGYKFELKYDDSNNTLYFTNKGCELPINTLLIGSTTKDGENTVGKYGEGYKLALLVLTRLGHKVTIKTGKSVWTPRIKYSKKYSSDILVIDVATNIFKTNSDVVDISVDGIDEEFYTNHLAEKFLKLRSEYPDHIKTTRGNILIDTRESGNIYVEGLYVCSIPGQDLCKGYDFKAGVIKLDRDRNKVQNFDIYYETSQLYAELSRKNLHKDMIADLLSSSKRDVLYLNSYDVNQDVVRRCDEEFVKVYGDKALPVDNETQYQHIKSYRTDIEPVIIESTRCSVLNKSARVCNMKYSPEILTVTTPRDYLVSFIDKHYEDLGSRAVDLLQEVLEESNKWSIS